MSQPFAPIESSFLWNLTIKSAFFIAVSSGKGASELQALGAEDEHISFSRIEWSHGQYKGLSLKFLVDPRSQKPMYYLPLRIRSQVYCKTWSFPEF